MMSQIKIATFDATPPSGPPRLSSSAMHVRVLGDADVERLLDLDALLEALARGFSALSDGRVAAPPRHGVDVTGRFLLSMVAHAPDHPMGVKLVSVFHDNHAPGLPGNMALIALFHEGTGAPLAVVNGTYITAMRTAGCAALSTRLLTAGRGRTPSGWPRAIPGRRPWRRSRSPSAAPMSIASTVRRTRCLSRRGS